MLVDMYVTQQNGGESTKLCYGVNQDNLLHEHVNMDMRSRTIRSTYLSNTKETTKR